MLLLSVCCLCFFRRGMRECERSEKKRKKNRHLKHFILLFDVQTLKYHLSSSFSPWILCVCCEQTLGATSTYFSQAVSL